MTTNSDREGPRPIRAEEMGSLGRLLNRTFRATRPGDMLAEFPHLLNEDNLGRLMVIRESGEVVCHAGMAVREIFFEGLPLTVGLVGAVATAEECRGRGYASECMDALLANAVRERVNLAWISGNRGLYTSRGAATVGRAWIYEIQAGAEPGGLRIEELRPDDLEAAARLYRQEPVRFLRTRDDWNRAGTARFVMNMPSRLWGAYRADALSAYLILHEASPRSLPLLAEFAGDRGDAAAALPAVAARMGIARVEAHVGEWDRRGCEALGRLAVASRLGSGWGTFLPLRMADCMENLRPRIAERCGQAIACAVRFSESGAGPQSRFGKDARLHVFLGPDEAQIVGRASVARFLLGAPDNAPPALEGSPGVLDALRPAFPLPTPWYGANFI